MIILSHRGCPAGNGEAGHKGRRLALHAVRGVHRRRVEGKRSRITINIDDGNQAHLAVNKEFHLIISISPRAGLVPLAVPAPHEGIVLLGRNGVHLGEATEGHLVNGPQNVGGKAESLKGLIDIVLVNLVAVSLLDCEEERKAVVAVHCIL